MAPGCTAEQMCGDGILIHVYPVLRPSATALGGASEKAGVLQSGRGRGRGHPVQREAAAKVIWIRAGERRQRDGGCGFLIGELWPQNEVRKRQQLEGGEVP